MSMGFQFLTLLGFLALLGIIILILIYILKPNYQQKVISSTFVWKMSLKYRKRRVPVSKLRNILLVLCQVLIIVICSWILAQPVIREMIDIDAPPECVLIIDTSANMMTQYEGETRFDRAIRMASDQIDAMHDHEDGEGGNVTVIMVGDGAKIVGGNEYYRVSVKTGVRRDNLKELLSEEVCSYGTGDPTEAMSLVETIIESNPKADVLFYTATEYTFTGCVQIVDVKAENNREWNAAILDCSAELEENDYLFSVEVACYGQDAYVEIETVIYGANNYDEEMAVQEPVYLQVGVNCAMGVPQTVEFTATDAGNSLAISSFESIYVHFVNVDDNFSEDNAFYIYGGVKDTVNIQLYSSSPNSFLSQALFSISGALKDTHDLFIQQIRNDDLIEFSGFDIYIFEHEIPEIVLETGLPTDGVVFLFDPNTVSGLQNIGFTLEDSETMISRSPVTFADNHPMTQYFSTPIELTKYRRITSYDDTVYQEVMSIDDVPIMLVKNETDSKIVVLSFSINYSTLSLWENLVVLLMNMVDYYVPLTMDSHVADVNTDVTLNKKGDMLSIVGPGVEETIYDLPTVRRFERPGTYRFSQMLMNGEMKEDYLYVRIARIESNIFREVDTLTDVVALNQEESNVRDLWLYFAIALVALLFAEWWLQSKEYFA